MSQLRVPVLEHRDARFVSLAKMDRWRKSRDKKLKVKINDHDNHDVRAESQ